MNRNIFLEGSTVFGRSEALGQGFFRHSEDCYIEGDGMRL